MSPHHLSMGEIASNDDERLANILRAFEHDISVEAGTIRWLIVNLQTARAGHVAVREVAEDPRMSAELRAELLEIVSESLAISEDD